MDQSKINQCRVATYPGIENEALFGGHVRRIRARVRESFAAVGTLERLLAGMNPNVLL